MKYVYTRDGGTLIIREVDTSRFARVEHDWATETIYILFDKGLGLNHISSAIVEYFPTVEWDYDFSKCRYPRVK